MNETFTTTITASVGEVIAGLKRAFPNNLRIQALPPGGQGVTLEVWGTGSVQIKWTRDARQLGE